MTMWMTHDNANDYRSILFLGLALKLKWQWKWQMIAMHENPSIWALNICINRHPTTFEGAYNINT